MRHQEEEFATPQAPAAIPGRQRAPTRIGGESRRNSDAVDNNRSADGTHDITVCGSDAFHKWYVEGDVTPVGNKAARSVRCLGEHEISPLHWTDDDPIEPSGALALMLQISRGVV